LLFCLKANSQNFKAGNFTYNWLNGYTYQIKLETFTEINSSNLDLCEVMMCFGDAMSAVVLRSNGPVAGGCSPAHDGVMITPVIKWSEYVTTHSFPGPGNYQCQYVSSNRNSGIINIPNSVNTNSSFGYFLNIPTFSSGQNSSPTFSNIPLAYGCSNHTFTYNPLATDIDNDSLTYSILSCRNSTSTVIPGYSFPVPGTFSINAVTGDLSWNNPSMNGDYNVIIKIEEWRKNDDGNNFLVGYTERDTQIKIDNCLTGLNKTKVNTELMSIHPNPAQDILKIKLNDFVKEKIRFIIVDFSGRILKEWIFTGNDSNTNEFNLEISEIMKGMYFLNIKENSISTTTKFIKQ